MGCCGCESLVRLISMRLSTTSRTVCGAVLRPTDVTGEAVTALTATTGLHDDADDTTVGRDVGGTICGR